MAQVWITEKYTQAAGLASVLGGRIERSPLECFRLGNGAAMVWAQGHLMELDAPERYHREWTWGIGGLKHIPFVPEQWRKSPIPERAQRARVVIGALRDATEIVIACDAGPAGELIARELIDASGNTRARILRVWLKAQNAEEVTKAARALRPGTETEGLARAAELRQRSDWIIGMNATILVTMRCRPAGARGVISVGRVQTPTLAVLVRRERERDAFVAQPTYRLEAEAVDAGGQRVTLRHDERPVLTDKAEAERRLAGASGHEGTLAVAGKRKKQGPPGPFWLNALQQFMSRTRSWGIQHTLDVAQALYDAPRRAITYPRTDGKGYESAEWTDCVAAWEALAQSPLTWANAIPSPPVRRAKLFNDKALESNDHPAIRTTTAIAHTDPGTWSPDERTLFDAIARRFAMQAMGDWIYDETTMQIAVPAGDETITFRTRGKMTREQGWRALLAERATQTTRAEGETPPEAGEENDRALPSIADGTVVRLENVRIVTGTTRPPDRLREGGLSAEMERLGLGTSATQGPIVEKIKTRGFCERGPREVLIPTALGRGLVEIMEAHAPQMVDAETTAALERTMQKVARGETSQHDAERALRADAVGIVNQLKSARLPVLAPPPAPKGQRGGAKPRQDTPAKGNAKHGPRRRR